VRGDNEVDCVRRRHDPRGRRSWARFDAAASRPPATYMPRKAHRRLVAWTKGGGTTVRRGNAAVTHSSIGGRRVLRDVLGGDMHAIGSSDRRRLCTHHGVYDAQIEAEVDVVDDVRAMEAKTNRRWRLHGQEQPAATHVGAPRVRPVRLCRAIDEDGRCRSIPLSEQRHVMTMVVGNSIRKHRRAIGGQKRKPVYRSEKRTRGQSINRSADEPSYELRGPRSRS
jgi:hypothetical protein